jgi:hypothetical protein
MNYIQKIKKLQSFFNPKLYTNIFAVTILLFSTFFSFNLLLNNSGNSLTAQAYSTCSVGFFDTTDGLCHENQVSPALCFDFNSPDGAGNCGYANLPLFDCIYNIPNQTEVFSAPAGDAKHWCTRTPYFFKYSECTVRSDIPYGGTLNNAYAFTDLMNYNPGTIGSPLSGNQNSDKMCTDGTNGCYAPGFRPFLMNTSVFHSNGLYKGFLCINKAFADGSYYNSKRIPQYSTYTDSSQSYLACPSFTFTDYPSLSFVSLGLNAELNSGVERNGLCAPNNGVYPASLHNCPANLPGYFVYNNFSYCYRTFTPDGVGCNAGQTLTNLADPNSCAQCPSTFYCAGGANAPKVTCPAGNYCPAGSSAPVICPAGSQCPTGSGITYTCQAGTYCPQGSASQTICPAGSYCSVGSGAHTVCPSGKTSPTGSSSITACVLGTTSSSSSSVSGISSTSTISSVVSNSSSSSTNVTPTFGDPTTFVNFPVYGRIGGKLPIVPLNGNTFPNGTVVKFIPAGCTSAQAMNGTITNNAFKTTDLIPTCALLGAQNAVLNYNTISPAVNISTNVETFFLATASASPVLGIDGNASAVSGVKGTSAPTFLIKNSSGETQVANGTSAEFVPAGCESTVGPIISGTIQIINSTDSNFVPVANQIIPTCATIGTRYGTLYSSGQTSGILTNFTTTVQSSSSNSSSTSTTSTQSSTLPTSPKIAAKVFLSANFDDASDTMTNDLRGNNILSTTQPYNASPYNYSGTESLPTTNLRTDLVDWVLLEVKDSTTGSTISKKPGVLTKDGNIIDPTNAVTGNTTLGVAVPVSTNGNYKVIIRHRNHISIATNTAISLSQSTTTTLDLTTNQNVKGSNQKQIGTIGSTPVYGLRLGDINSDGSVDALDRSIIRSAQETTNTYIVQDINLDGSIDSLDRNILRLADETVEDL